MKDTTTPMTKDAADVQKILDHITSERREVENYVHKEIENVHKRVDALQKGVSNLKRDMTEVKKRLESTENRYDGSQSRCQHNSVRTGNRNR